MREERGWALCTLIRQSGRPAAPSSQSGRQAVSYPIISCSFCLSPTLKTMSYDTATGRAQTAPDFSIYKAFPFPFAPLVFLFRPRCLVDMTTLAPSVYHKRWYTHSPGIQSHLPGQKPGDPFLMGLSHLRGGSVAGATGARNVGSQDRRSHDSRVYGLPH